MSYLTFSIIFIAAAIADGLLGISSLRKPLMRSKMLALTLFAASLVTVMYLLSVLAPDKFTMSVFSSLYFCSTNLLVIFLLMYTLELTNPSSTFKLRKEALPFIIYGAFDVVVMLANPFTGIAVEYVYQPDALAHWRYDSGILHMMHMAFTYLDVAFVCFLMARKLVTVPSMYRRRYASSMMGLAVVLCANAVFVFLPNNTLIDFSILIYTLLGAFYYWNDTDYSRKRMLGSVQDAILDYMGRPMVLFDYEGCFTICNVDMSSIIPPKKQVETYRIEDFLVDANLPEGLAKATSDSTFQWDSPHGLIYRCDNRLLDDGRGHIAGRLFVFTDVSLERDLLTGFAYRSTMEKHFEDSQFAMESPVAVVVCDLNRLATINHQEGRDVGDRALRLLSNLMRKHCPEGTYFVRIEDANLVAICPETNMLTAREIFDEINASLNAAPGFAVQLDMQSAICMMSTSHPNLSEALTNAVDTLKTRKILDDTSNHASLLASLAQAQNENDPLTEAHVQRTRLMGDMLGRRMGLTDYQLNNLSLLCLLHDIGKLGVPLEILNKPGRLTPEEWDVMRSHVEKGYNIAMVAKELKGIADCILHHHECWDGTGYPNNLSRESIPLLARIIAVVDAYDAMTNDRPYRQGTSVAGAVAELRRCAGRQFDPKVVAEFIALLGEMYPDEFAVEEVSVEMEPESLPIGAIASRDADGIDDDAAVPTVRNGRFWASLSGGVLDGDEGFCQLSGYSSEDASSHALLVRNLLFAEDRTTFLRGIQRDLEEMQWCVTECRLRRKDGSGRDVLCSVRGYFDAASREMRCEVSLVDLADTAWLRKAIDQERTRARASYERWEGMFRRDSLTGLLNHEAFYSDSQLGILDYGSNVALMVLDLDKFKECNDTYGHLAGDDLLRGIANTLAEVEAEGGIAGRMGGDEFAVMLRFATDASDEDIMAKAQEIRQRVNATAASHLGECTVSVGVARASDASESVSSLYRRADRALYASKRGGRNRLTFGK